MLEYGIAIPQGVSRVRHQLSGILEDAENELSSQARVLFGELQEELYELNDRIKQADIKVKAHGSKSCRLPTAHGDAWHWTNDRNGTYQRHW